MDFDTWSIHADSWIWLCAMALGNKMISISPTSIHRHRHTHSLSLSFFCSDTSTARYVFLPVLVLKTLKICAITWFQVIDSYIKNDYDGTIASERVCRSTKSNQIKWMAQKSKFLFNVRFDVTLSFLRKGKSHHDIVLNDKRENKKYGFRWNVRRFERTVHIRVLWNDREQRYHRPSSILHHQHMTHCSNRSHLRHSS